MNGCGHCENMHDDWERVKSELENSHNDKKIAIVDVDSNAASQMNLGRSILGFPTIMHTRNGKEISKYEGPRKSKQMKDWILKSAKSLKDNRSSAKLSHRHPLKTIKSLSYPRSLDNLSTLSNLNLSSILKKTRKHKAKNNKKKTNKKKVKRKKSKRKKK
tara:strand:- start:216 stop:695 length:480 start_codon:yes stop_codon:yes gene_type:complete